MTKADLLRILDRLPMNTQIAIGAVPNNYSENLAEDYVHGAYTFTGLKGLTLILTDGVFVPEASDLESIS